MNILDYAKYIEEQLLRIKEGFELYNLTKDSIEFNHCEYALLLKVKRINKDSYRFIYFSNKEINTCDSLEEVLQLISNTNYKNGKLYEVTDYNDRENFVGYEAIKDINASFEEVYISIKEKDSYIENSPMMIEVRINQETVYYRELDEVIKPYGGCIAIRPLLQ